MSKYAKKLTKQELIDGGITEITPEGRIFKHEIDITDNLNLNPSGYRIFYIYERDPEGRCIKQYYRNKKGKLTYNYKQRTITLNRAVLAWYNGEVPDGYVSDHVNNKERDNYSLENLQALTAGENIRKERENCSMKELKCNMRKHKSFYEEKLEKYLTDYENAKATGNAEKAHKLRSNISQIRAKIRYWTSHEEEYWTFSREEDKKEIKKLEYHNNAFYKKLLQQWSKYFKESGNKAMWHEVCRVIKAWNSLTADKQKEIFEKLNKNFPNVQVGFVKETL